MALLTSPSSSLGLRLLIQAMGVTMFQSLMANFPKHVLLTSRPMRYSGRKEFHGQVSLRNKASFTFLLKILSPHSYNQGSDKSCSQETE